MKGSDTMNFDKRDWNARQAVLGAAKTLIEKGFKVVSVNLYGSQNYDCDTPESDFDFKAIIVPTLDDIILNRKPVSHDVEFRGGLIDIKDIRLMFDNYKKQNVNFVETMFTRWFWANPDFVHQWDQVRALAGKIAFADPAKSINCMIGMAKEKEHALAQPYPSKVAILEKYGFDPKQLMHIVRLYFLMEAYIAKFEAGDFNYGEILIPNADQKAELMDIKLMNREIDLEMAKDMAAEHITIMEALRDKFKHYHPNAWGAVNEDTYAQFDEIKADIMKRAFTADLMQEAK